MNQKRIISLLPAATEIIYALGLGELLVGRSHECDFPDEVRNLPVCTSSRLTAEDKSEHIDREVKKTLSEALSIYAIDEEKIRELKPDVIITQTQCEVCAVSLKDVEQAVSKMAEGAVEIISLESYVLPDIWSGMQAVAQKLGVADRSQALMGELEERTDIIKHKLKFIEDRPKVACIEWLSPLMLSGNWIPEVIEAAGGEPVWKGYGKPSKYIEFEDILEADPDVLLIIPCGFSIARSLKEIDLLLHQRGWDDLNAVKNNKIYIADGNHYFNRPGPRIVDSIELLAEILYPKQFTFGFEGNGWLHFDLA